MEAQCQPYNPNILARKWHADTRWMVFLAELKFRSARDKTIFIANDKTQMKKFDL